MMKKIKDMSIDAKVPVIEKMGYAIGGSGSNFIVMIMSTFLLVYYTNVVGVSAGLVATVMGVTKIFDGLSDLVAGYIVDHTKSKYGKGRPWLIRMILPMLVSTYMMFDVPQEWSTIPQIAYIFVTYNLTMTVCLTILSVAHAALNGMMSINQKDRGINGGLHMLLGIVGGVIINSTVLQITSAVGNGNPYTQKGWSVMILIYLVFYVVCSVFGFFFTTERVSIAERQKDKEECAEKKKEEVSVKTAFWALIHNKYWLIFIVTMLFISYMQMSNGMSNVYYAQYVLDDVYLYTPLANFSNIAALVGAAVVFALLGKMSKRNIIMMGLVSLTVGSLMPLFSISNAWLYASSALKGFGGGVGACVLPGMLQDTLTYSEWKAGVSVVGMGTAAQSFCTKLGGSIGTIMLGWLLEFGKFNAALEVQPDSAIQAINILYIWVPFITTALSVLVMSRYDLDKKYDQIATEVKARISEKTKSKEV